LLSPTKARICGSALSPMTPIRHFLKTHLGKLRDLRLSFLGTRVCGFGKKLRNRRRTPTNVGKKRLPRPGRGLSTHFRTHSICAEVELPGDISDYGYLILSIYLLDFIISLS
jgi:hypothetical protein